MSFTNCLLGHNWDGEWPGWVEVGHEGATDGRRYVPEPCDRERLLELAEDVDGAAEDSGGFEPLAGMLHDIARRIREACGEGD